MTNFYVSKTGNNSNSGTAPDDAHAKLTISGALSLLSPGDTLFVQNGLYAESFNYGDVPYIPKGNAGSPVTLKVYPGHSVTIRPTASVSCVFDFRTVPSAGYDQQYITLDGFIIDGDNVTTFVVEIADTCHDIILQNCEVHDGLFQGINVGPDSNNNQFINCHVHDVGTSDLHHGIYLASHGNIVDGCTIHDIHTGYGVHIYNGYSVPGVDPGHTHNWTADNNIVRNCTIHDTGAGSSGFSSGILVSLGDNNRVYNNVIYRGGYSGIRVWSNSTNAMLYNNTIFGNGTVLYGILIEPTAVTPTGTLLTNNIAYGHGVNISDSGSGTIPTTNLTTDPSFVDAGSFDFHLQVGSSAIGTGTASPSVLTTDKDGRDRGTSWDIGALEFQPPGPARRFLSFRYRTVGR